MHKTSVFMLSMVGLFMLCGGGCSVATGSAGEEPVATSQAELTGWLGPISDESGINNRSFSQPNIAATNAFCSGDYCDNNYLYGSALPSGVTTGTEHPTGLFISEESPNNSSFCVDSSGFLNGVITGLAASGGHSDNIELLCSPLSFSSGRRWGSCKWTSSFSEENGGYPTGWTSGYYATGLSCSGSNCDNMRYYICNFL